jgi:hypothetical protein
VTFENGVISALRHFEQELLEAFFGFLGEQGYAKNASVSLFYRGPFFSGLLLESLDYGFLKVSDE